MTSRATVDAVEDRSGRRFRLFASPAGAPRARRTIDWFTGTAAFGVFVLAGWAARSEISLDERVLVAFARLPGWLEFLARCVFTLGGLYALGLVVAIAVRGRGRRIVRDLLVALGLLALVVVVAARLAGGQWPDLFPEYIDPGRPSYPNLRIALLTAVVVTPAPHLVAPLRTFGRRMIAATVVAAIVLGIATVTGLLGGVALGAATAALVHLLFGSPAGLPSTERLMQALSELGVDVSTVELLDDQPIGVALAEAVGPGGERYVMKVYGRDAADAELASKVWRSFWYRDSGPAVSLTGLQQVEHEAVAALLAERRGAPVEHVVVAGEDADGNAFLVAAEPLQRPLADVDADEVDDADLDSLWRALLALHQAGVAHGSIRPEVVMVGDDGVLLADLSRSSLSLQDQRVQTDVVSLMASLACAVGAQRAVASAVRCLDREQIAAALPYLQDGVLAPSLRRRLSSRSSTSELVTLLTEQTALDAPELAEVRRIEPRDIAMVVFGVFAVIAILSQIAEVGLDTLLEEIGNANNGWLLTGFLIGLAGYVGDVISLKGVLDRPVPIAPTLILQSAKRFIGLAVPTAAARVVTDVRFFQKLGVPSAVALAQGPLIGFVGFLAEVTLMLLGVWTIGQTIEFDDLGNGNAGWILVAVIALVVVAVIAVLAIPKLRRKVVPPVRAALAAMVDVVRNPRRIGQVFVGQVVERVAGALALAATLAAFGQQLPFAAVLFVTVATGLLAGLVPVPGGIGVAEATMAALLTGVGLPAEIAFSTAIVYRFLTSYLPPVLGWFSLRWLTTNGYL